MYCTENGEPKGVRPFGMAAKLRHESDRETKHFCSPQLRLVKSQNFVFHQHCNVLCMWIAAVVLYLRSTVCNSPFHMHDTSFDKSNTTVLLFNRMLLPVYTVP